MDNPINLLFTIDKKYYTDKNELIIWNYFIPKNIDDCISFVTIYQPKMILLDTSVDHKTILECISKIKHTYTYSPITIFAEKGKIFEVISNDLLPNCKSKCKIEIPMEIEKKLDFALAEFKFSPALKGYNFIKRCIFEGICNPTIFDNIEKNLYNKVAEIFLTSKYSIERAINFSIKKAFSENPSSFHKYINQSDSPPSNGKFLKILLVHIKYLDATPKLNHMPELQVNKNFQNNEKSNYFTHNSNYIN